MLSLLVLVLLRWQSKLQTNEIRMPLEYFSTLQSKAKQTEHTILQQRETKETNRAQNMPNSRC
jgi:hypothetical protein